MKLSRLVRTLSLFLLASYLGSPFSPAGAATSAQVTVNTLKAGQSTVAPGQAVTATATFTANASLRGYPVEFSWTPNNSTSSQNKVVFTNFSANAADTLSWSGTVPAGTKAASYTLIAAVYNPQWTQKLATASTVVTIGTAGTTTTGSSGGSSSGSSGSGTTTGSSGGSSSGSSGSGTTTGSSGGSSSGSSGSGTTTGSSGGSGTSPSAETVAVPPTGSGTVSAQVPGPSAALFNAPFYSCVNNYYVATTGSDSNPGTQASPWLTIQHADSSARQGGDCINVAAGTYQKDVLIQHGGSAPTPTGYITYRCETLDACHVIAPGSGHLWGIKQPANFIVIDGFELDGNSEKADACVGSDGDTYGTGNSSHHLWILNNLIHDCNMSGIQINNKEWYYAIHNTVYNNSWTSGYQGSGISFVVVQCVESGNAKCASGSTYAGGTGTYVPSGMDLTYAPPFHNLVMWNNVYNNKIAANNPVACGSHTDGNGIIMDTFLDETTLKIVYPYQTLVAGNTSYANGGRGIHVFRTSNATVVNNTTYANGTDTCINAYYLADLSQAGGSNNVWINNIAQSVLTAANPSCGADCGDRNAPLVAGNASGISDSNNTFMNNILYGGDGVQLFNADTGYFSCSSNKCATNPALVSPAATNFAVQSTSPAVGYGLAGYYMPDAGACSATLATCE